MKSDSRSPHASQDNFLKNQPLFILKLIAILGLFKINSVKFKEYI